MICNDNGSIEGCDSGLSLFLGVSSAVTASPPPPLMVEGVRYAEYGVWVELVSIISLDGIDI